MIPLVGRVQKYAWGRRQATSEVAQLAAANGQDVNSEERYAELWLGTHPSGPSSIAGQSAVSLRDWVDAHPQALGQLVREKFGGDLPFLLKVLSVETALSIQSHPDKALAKLLHKTQPQNYKDANHKPEMALAISDFEALCGFVEMPELQAALKQNSELESCIGPEIVRAVMACAHSDKAVLKAAFTALMTCDAAAVKDALHWLIPRLENKQANSQLSDKEALVLRLHEQYPGDVGVLAAFFLNYLKLQPGEAIFLSANEPHAYLSGELVECMATSDNVIRAGLTPKYRDTTTLCESLTYRQGLPEVLHGEPIEPMVRRYAPPLEEFELLAINVPLGQTVHLAENKGPTVLLVQYGEATGLAMDAMSHSSPVKTDLARGSVFFVPAGTAVKVTDVQEPLVMWAARCNHRLFQRQPQPLKLAQMLQLQLQQQTPTKEKEKSSKDSLEEQPHAKVQVVEGYTAGVRQGLNGKPPAIAAAADGFATFNAKPMPVSGRPVGVSGKLAVASGKQAVANGKPAAIVVDEAAGRGVGCCPS